MVKGLFDQARKWRGSWIKRGRGVLHSGNLYYISATDGSRLTLRREVFAHPGDCIYEASPEYHAALRLLHASVDKLEDSDIFTNHDFNGIDKQKTLELMRNIVLDEMLKLKSLDS